MDIQRSATVDHSLLSPSGHVSRRTERAAKAREAARLFPPGYWDKAALTPDQMATAQAEALRQRAKELSELSRRGMSPRMCAREAARLLAAAEALEAGRSG